MNKAATSRKFLTPVLGALALAGGLAMSGAGFSAPAQAEAAKAVDAELGREMFNTWSCSACHALSDAGAAGAVGPSLDNPALTRDLIIDRVANGQGAMPSFGGQMSNDEIATLADYIVAANHSHTGH